MPGKSAKHGQRKGPKNAQSPSVNRTGRAADKAQEAKQRSQSIVQKLRNSANKDSSDPFEEDSEVDEDAEDQAGTPRNLEDAFDMETPKKLDQREGEVVKFLLVDG